MQSRVNLSVDGRDVAVDQGATLIAAAAAAGVKVPNLCHLNGMKGVGACRLCVVEIEGSDAPVTACTTKAKEGMVVVTDTERVREIRRFVLDLILSMHPSDCMTCPKAGVCDLQRYAYEHDLGDSSFTRKTSCHAIDDSNPFVRRDPGYCVLCGRCVRVCGSQGTGVLRFNGRGLGSKIVSGSDSPLEDSDCTFCGNCVDACPVGALLPVQAEKRGREWEHAKTRTTCLSCACACDLVVSLNGGQVVKVGSPASAGDEGRFICAVGRFGFEGLQSHLRVSRPLKRVDGELVETGWDDALALVAAKLRAAKGGVGVVTGGSLLNEDALQLKKLAEGVLRTDHYDSSASLYSDRDLLFTPGGDVNESDLIVLVGLSPDQWARVLPALDASIRERVGSRAAELVVVNAERPRIASVASVVLGGDEMEAIAQLCRALVDVDAVPLPGEMLAALADVAPSDEAKSAAALFAAARSPLVLAAPSLYRAAANLALFKGTAAAVPFEANARGLAWAGLRGGDWSFRQILEAPVPVLYAIGALPPVGRPHADFVVVQTPFLTEIALAADVVLPSATGLESEGSVIDALGRVKHVRRARDPFGEARQDGEIFAALAKALGATLDLIEAPHAAPVGAPASGGFSPFSRRREWDIDPRALVEAVRRPVVEGSRLAWLDREEDSEAA